MIPESAQQMLDDNEHEQKQLEAELVEIDKHLDDLQDRIGELVTMRNQAKKRLDDLIHDRVLILRVRDAYEARHKEVSDAQTTTTGGMQILYNQVKDRNEFIRSKGLWEELGQWLSDHPWDMPDHPEDT